LRWTKKDFLKWKQFFECMVEGHSIRKAAMLCRIHRNTAFMWRHKILGALAQHHDAQPLMKGIVEADDTFFLVSFKGGKPIGRESYQRGTPAPKRGISRDSHG
jgi:transposase-like protein